MNQNISAASLAIIKKMQQSELTESVIYEKIAKFAKGEENKATLLLFPAKNVHIMKSGKNIPALQ